MFIFALSVRTIDWVVIGIEVGYMVLFPVIARKLVLGGCAVSQRGLCTLRT